jgi:hypothetical protein
MGQDSRRLVVNHAGAADGSASVLVECHSIATEKLRNLDKD